MGKPGIVARQRREPVREVMMIGSVEFVRRRIARMVARQRPQHRAADEQQGQRRAAGKDLSGEPCDPWALHTEPQGLRPIIR